MNKKVPEWLNSSVWISNPSQRDRTSDLSSSTSTTAASDAPPPPITEPPLPVPPPSVAGREEPSRFSPTRSDFQIKESKSGDGEEGDQPAGRDLSEDDVSRQSHLLAELSKKVVDMREVRRITAQGIPDGAGIRSTVWKLLLGYLPTDRSLWSSELIKKRSQYNNFKRELLINPLARCFRTLASLRRLLSSVALGGLKQQLVLLSGEGEDGGYEGVGCFDGLYVLFLQTFCFNFCKILILEPNSRCFHGSQSEVVRKLDDSSSCESDHSHPQSSGILLRSDITCGEHPLSLGKTSIWNRFFQDTEVVEQIDRDVKRTHPDMHFFSGDTPAAISNQDAVKTILILYAKLNPGIRYIQGMNEVLAPLFYVFKNDPDADNADFVEADAFFCFVEILSGFRDNFCQQLDNSVGGIRSTISKLSELLKDHDEELWRHLEITTKVNPQFYAFRWITLLLTQEFNFADSLQIWDFLLSDPEGPQETLLRVCCAMLILIRRRLLGGDFTSNLRLLQNYPSTNISHLLYVANKLQQKPSC